MNDYMANDQPLAVPWRCFFCDEVFTDREAAADHFGVQIDGLADEPGCKLNAAEGGLLKILREFQTELAKYHEEDHESYRTFHALGAEHQVALQREEEKGYARGLADAKADYARGRSEGFDAGLLKAAQVCEGKVLDPLSNPFDNGCQACAESIRACIEPPLAEQCYAGTNLKLGADGRK